MQLSVQTPVPQKAFPTIRNICRPPGESPYVQGSQNAVSALHTKFAAWDMTTIKQYMVENAIYAPEEIDSAETEYKRWLSLAVAYMPKSVPISEKVDKFWHTHILFTEDYTAMGQSIVGHYLHHRPSILDDRTELAGAFGEHTLSLYYQNFGKPDPVFWDSVLCRCGPTE